MSWIEMYALNESVELGDNPKRADLFSRLRNTADAAQGRRIADEAPDADRAQASRLSAKYSDAGAEARWDKPDHTKDLSTDAGRRTQSVRELGNGKRDSEEEQEPEEHDSPCHDCEDDEEDDGQSIGSVEELDPKMVRMIRREHPDNADEILRRYANKLAKRKQKESAPQDQE